MSRGRKTLFIQIPCLNEQSTIAEVIRSIPKKPFESLGFNVKILVVDDNSRDATARIAKKAGADFIISHNKTMGLAKCFSEGLEFCLKNGADIIVNTDGDNQYDQKEISKLVKPVIEGKADLVIGDRQVGKLKFMPKNKFIGNKIGDFVISRLTGMEISDASSGFRAFTRQFALALNLQSDHTYTHETIIQAKYLGFSIMFVPVTFRERISGKSRLINSGVYYHIKKSAATIIRTILLYKAFKYLVVLGSLITLIGVLIGIRFLFFFFDGVGTGHIQSLVLSSVLINLGFMVIVLGFMADLISVNRKTIEDIKRRLN